jgi:hypothetical protein
MCRRLIEGDAWRCGRVKDPWASNSAITTRGDSQDLRAEKVERGLNGLRHTFNITISLYIFDQYPVSVELDQLFERSLKMVLDPLEKRACLS